jgi:hypothetical protein
MVDPTTMDLKIAVRPSRWLPERGVFEGGERNNTIASLSGHLL